MNSFIVTLVLTALSLIADANAEEVSTAVTKEIQLISAESRLMIWDTGDLNKDGIKDLVIRINEDETGNTKGTDGRIERIFVLRGSVDHKYGLLAKSLPYEFFEGNGWHNFGVSIKNGSLFLKEFGPCDPESACTSTYQFKYRDSGLYLIGYKSDLGSKEGILDHNLYVGNDQQLSINFLTGERVEWRKIGNRRREISSKIPLDPPIKLDQFNFDVIPNKSIADKSYGFTIDAF